MTQPLSLISVLAVFDSGHTSIPLTAEPCIYCSHQADGTLVFRLRLCRNLIGRSPHHCEQSEHFICDTVATSFICFRRADNEAAVTPQMMWASPNEVVPANADTNEKSESCRFRIFGAGSRGRTDTVSLPLDFESSTSANSIIPAYLYIISYLFRKIKCFFSFFQIYCEKIPCGTEDLICMKGKLTGAPLQKGAPAKRIIPASRARGSPRSSPWIPRE